MQARINLNKKTAGLIARPSVIPQTLLYFFIFFLAAGFVFADGSSKATNPPR